MPLNHPKSHHSFVPEYQVSGIPFVITSADDDLDPNLGNPVTFNSVRVTFPNVSQFVIVQNTGTAGASAALRMGFTDNGVRHLDLTQDEHYFLVPAGETTQLLPIRCKELWFANDGVTGQAAIGFSVMAGLTSVDRFLHLTGSIAGDVVFEGVG